MEPQSAALVAELPVRSGTATAGELRSGHAALTTLLVRPGPNMADVADLTLPAGDGVPPLAVRRYVPYASTRKALIYLHGGGWVTGTLDTYDALCRKLAIACGVQVFSVDYRLSPETRYPAAINDTMRAFDAIQDLADRFGLDVGRIMLGGDSAGGHLAVTAARWIARRANPVAPGPAALALIYPVADRRLVSDSAVAFAQGHYLTRDMMDWYWHQFVGDQAISADDPDLSPARATDLHGLPPTYVLTAGCDILRDEGELLARRLSEAGCNVIVERVPGVIHGFIRFDARLDAAPLAISSLASGLARLVA